MCMNNGKSQQKPAPQAPASPLALPPDPDALGSGMAAKAGNAIKDRKRRNALALEEAN